MLNRRVVILAAFCLATAGWGQFVEDSAFVGAGWVASLDYNPWTKVIYGTCEDDGSYFAIDCRTLDHCGGGDVPAAYAIVYDSTDSVAYCSFGAGGDESLRVVEGYTHNPIRTFAVPGAGPLVWDPDVDRLYTSCGYENDVAVIDCKTDSIITRIHTGAYPLGLTLNRPHRKLYVQNDDGESVSIIDLNTNQVTKTIPLGIASRYRAGCYNSSVGKYYCGGNLEVVVIDGSGDTVVSRIAMPNYLPAAIAESPLHGLVMVAVGDSVLTVDPSSDSVVSRLRVGQQPWDIVWSAATDLLYTANYSNDVTVIAGDGTRVLTTLPVGLSPFVLIPVPEFHRVFVGHLGSIWMYVIRDTVSGVAEASASALPRRHGLTPKPNPFRNSLVLHLGEAMARAGSITVLSLTGSLVRTLNVPVRSNDVTWDGKDKDGKEVSAGVYVAVASWRPGESVRVVKTE